MRYKWLLIARNEYRIRTSSIRRIRPAFPFIVVAILAVYVAYGAPALVKFFADEILALFLSRMALAMTEIILFIIFAYFMVIPITNSLREQEPRQMELYLSAPIRSRDVLLGEFLGRIPLYGIAITVIAGFFAAILTPFGLSAVQLAITVIVFVVVFLSGLWIGTLMSAVLRTRLGKSSRGKDIGRALGMVLALPILALFYAIMFGGLLDAVADPSATGLVKTLLEWLPSSWGAEVIIACAANPGNVIGCGMGMVARLIGLFLFFVAILYVGTRAAGRVYSLEIHSFISVQARPDGVFYKSVMVLSGGGSFGRVVTSLFKDYSRRLENISGITYMLGLLFLMILFIAPQSGGSDDPPVGLLFLEFIFPIIVVMLTGDVTLRGKQSLFLFRKTPHGEHRFIRAMLMKSWLLVIPIVGVVTGVVASFTLESGASLFMGIVGMMMVYVTGYVVVVLGLFLLNPVFSEKSVKLWVNIMVAVFLSIGLFVTSLLILTQGGRIEDPAGGLPLILLVQGVMCWAIGLVILRIGRMRFERVE